MTKTTIWITTLSAALALSMSGCATSGKGAPYEPTFGGKADFEDRVERRGELSLPSMPAEVMDELTEDFELHGWTIAAPAGAQIDAEVTQRGTARGLDTTLFVYGPLRELVAPPRLAFDDDDGWGLLSRVEGVTLPEAGNYLVIVGSQDGLGRGRYRLELRCTGDACSVETPTGCPHQAERWLESCARGQLWEAEFEITRHQALEACVSEPALVRETWDAPCDFSYPPHFCAVGFDAYVRDILPACHARLLPDWAPIPDPGLVLERFEVGDALRELADVDDGDPWTEVSIRGYHVSDPNAPIGDIAEEVRQATLTPALFRAETPPGHVTHYLPYYALEAAPLLAALADEAGVDEYRLAHLTTIYPDDLDDIFVFAFDNGVVLALRLRTDA